MEEAKVKAWVDKYREAWGKDDPELIRDLFTEDAVYLTGPWDEPWTGIDQITKSWIEIGDSDIEWEFGYEILALGPEVAVLQGWTTYPGKDGQPDADYSNIWLIRFGSGDKAREFREWWVQKPAG